MQDFRRSRSAAITSFHCMAFESAADADADTTLCPSHHNKSKRVRSPLSNFNRMVFGAETAQLDVESTLFN
jgi:hypothetical protein